MCCVEVVLCWNCFVLLESEMLYRVGNHDGGRAGVQAGRGNVDCVATCWPRLFGFTKLVRWALSGPSLVRESLLCVCERGK